MGPNNVIVFIKKENFDIIGREILINCTVKESKLASINKFFWLFWVQFILPISALLSNCDVLFSPGNIAPIIKSTKIKSQWVATIGPFDQNVYEGLSYWGRIFLAINKLLMLASMRTSNIIIHESKYSQNFFIKEYKLKKENNYLIECGRSDFFFPVYERNDVSNKFIKDMRSTDFLCVSHLYPYKNLETLITAFSSYLTATKKDHVRLFICGMPVFEEYYQKLLGHVESSGCCDNIIFVGNVSQADLRYAYSTCRFMVFPSLCESSGYTLIEAMSCGAAIITTKLTAMPFTCGEAASYFDALNNDDLFMKILELDMNESALNTLKKKSIIRQKSLLSYSESTALFCEFLANKT